MIIITRGYPASGKSTWARQWVTDGAALEQKRARVNRDDFRSMVYDASGVLPYEHEQIVTKLQREAVVRLVKGGHHVVIDDTNLRLKYARAWADLAVELGVEFSVRDFETHVDICLDRDWNRHKEVGEEVIRNFAARFPLGRWPAVTPTEKATTRTWPVYTPDTSLPAAYIVDIDGTIAAKQTGEGSRGWHEYGRIGEDLPKRVIIDIVNGLRPWRPYRGVADIVFVSGRKEHCLGQTRNWLAKHVGKWTWDCELFMRGDDDNRADDIVKNEIFETLVKHRWNILATIDDRQRVVDMWRAKGLTCLQVDAWAEAGS